MNENEGFTNGLLTRRQCIALSGYAAGGLLATQVLAATDAAPPPKPVKPGRAVRVAVVLGEHNTLIDFAGPWEILSSAVYHCPGFAVYGVARSRAAVICDDGRGLMESFRKDKPASGLTVVPDYTFDDAPQPDVILMGGQDSKDDTAAIAWIRNAARKAQASTSVCTGAFLLAQTGLLDGKRATTNRNAYDNFQKKFPAVNLVRGVRFVDSGDVVTATGLTAGIDLALHLIDRFYGRGPAEAVANYEEWSGSAWTQITPAT
jgi:transcriptional regulator GlxA family with amidase domain